jgi:hypothetical protein
VVQERVLNEMLGGIQDSTGGGWKVLILDSTTTRILSSAMRMSDILEAGGSHEVAWGLCVFGWECGRGQELQCSCMQRNSWNGTGKHMCSARTQLHV